MSYLKKLQGGQIDPPPSRNRVNLDLDKILKLSLCWPLLTFPCPCLYPWPKRSFWTCPWVDLTDLVPLNLPEISAWMDLRLRSVLECKERNWRVEMFVLYSNHILAWISLQFNWPTWIIPFKTRTVWKLNSFRFYNV